MRDPIYIYCFSISGQQFRSVFGINKPVEKMFKFLPQIYMMAGHPPQKEETCLQVIPLLAVSLTSANPM